ncbi:ABC transporter permease [Chitinophaga sp.]|uniref:ABC transporter permease n=1 Tax=Chitinophaga sp. TaxID=1869181 RepID=UPI0031D0003C
MNRLLSLMQQELRLFLSNKVMMILYLGGPVLYGAMFGLVYVKGKFTDLPVIVIDKDHSPTSIKLVDMLDETDVLKLTRVTPDNVDLEKAFLAEAAFGAVVIPDHFEADVLRGRRPEVNAYINNTNLLAAGYVNRAIQAVLGSKKEMFHLTTIRLFNRASNYFMYIWPSYLAIILQSVVMVVVALSFATMQETGTLGKLYAESGYSAARLMAGKILPYILFSFVLLGIYGLYFFLFRQSFPLHTGIVIMITLLFTLTNSFIGMIAGLLFKSQLSALQFLMILSMPVYISSGFSWPFDQDGPLARLFGFIFPYMPYVNGFRILLIEQGRAADISDYIWMQCLQLVGYFLAAVGILRYIKK